MGDFRCLHIKEKKIGSVTQCTEVYVRLPIFFESQALTTAATLCTINIHSHTFIAEVIYTDKRQWWPKGKASHVQPWECKANGKVLPGMTPEQTEKFNKGLRRGPGYNRDSLDKGVKLEPSPCGA